MRTNNKRGISLIVLVITIIVMIILAGAVILAISNSGIIDKANKAKKDSDLANLKEYANVLEAEWEMMTTDERVATGCDSRTEYVNKKLQEKGYTNVYYGEDGLLEIEEYDVAITSSEQIYALGRLLNNNTRTVAGLTNYKTSEQINTDLALFGFPDNITDVDDKIAYLQTASYGLENDITVTLKRGYNANCFLGIGGEEDPFKGKFYGNGKTITLMGNTIAISGDFAKGMGLFGKTENAKIANLKVVFGSDILINSLAQGSFSLGLLVGNASVTEIRNVSIQMDNDITVDFNTNYRSPLNCASLVGYIDSCKISNCQVDFNNSSIKINNQNSENQHKYYVGGLIGIAYNVNAINSCDVKLNNSQLGFNLANTGGTGHYYGSAVGGLLGYAGPGSDNTNNIGRNGTTITKCNVISTNSEKQEIIFAKEAKGESPNAGGILGLTFNNCSILNSNVDVTNGIIISSRTEENTTESRLGSTCGGIIGRLEHTGRISECTVKGNNLDIIAESTEREIYSGGIVGYDVGPYHKDQISLENNKIIGNGSTTVKVKVISENSKVNRYIGAGGIAGSSTYIIKNCEANGVKVINQGTKSNSLVSAMGKIIGIYAAQLNGAVWLQEKYFTPSQNTGVFNCTNTNVILETDNESVVSSGNDIGKTY